MDIQGAELLAYKGLEERIRDVKVIHTKVEFLEIYEGQPLFGQVKRFLSRKGFLLVGFTEFGEYSADAVFVNLSMVRSFPRKMRYFLLDRTLCFRGILSPGLRELVLRVSPLSPKSLVRRRIIRWFGEDVFVPGEKRLTAHRLGQLLFLRFGKRFLRWDPNFRAGISSDIPLDVVIPVIEKDLWILPTTVSSLRKHVKHPLGKIFAVSPPSRKIEEFCRRAGCAFVQEDEVSPLEKCEVEYISLGVDRSGWLLQQLIKLNADTVSSSEYILVFDADTVLVRPQIFLFDGKVIFSHSNEYHRPYFSAHERILREKPQTHLSFVSHHMLFQRSVLLRLKRTIEEIHRKPWYRAVLENLDFLEFSAFAEYETYGNFFLSRYRGKALQTYWFNLLLPKEKFADLQQLEEAYGQNYKSISFPTHEKPNDGA